MLYYVFFVKSHDNPMTTRKFLADPDKSVDFTAQCFVRI